MFNKKKKPILFIDLPKVEVFSERVNIVGWHASQSPLKSIFIEGRSIDTFNTTKRIDVEKEHPEYLHVTGFSFTINGIQLFGKNEIELEVLCTNGTKSKSIKTLESNIQCNIKLSKLNRIKSHLRTDLPHAVLPTRYDFMTDLLRDKASIIEATATSSHSYTPEIYEEIDKIQNEGLILDCGAGYRKTQDPRIIHFEIEPYISTDIRGIAENLPFKDNTFDLILSIVVLEHVKNPQLAVSEMERVLKPGGRIWIDVAFMQPFHGYPSHYFNMTSEGLKSLFSTNTQIVWEKVPDYGTPIWSLTWILLKYIEALPNDIKETFGQLKISDLLKPGDHYKNKNWVLELSDEGNRTLAATNSILVSKKDKIV